MNCVAGDSSFGLRIRANWSAKLFAVTLSPFEKRVKPALTVKSYVRPPFVTRGRPAAASGVSVEPFGASASG